MRPKAKLLPLGVPHQVTFAPGRRAWWFRLASGTYLVTMRGGADGVPGPQIGYVWPRPREKKDDPMSYGAFASKAPIEPDPKFYQGSYPRFASAVAGLFAQGGR